MPHRKSFVTSRRAPVGTPPGTLIRDASASPTHLHLIIIEDDEVRTVDGADLGVVERELKRGSKLWLDLEGLGDHAMLSELARLFDIAPLALEDIVNTNQRPKVDVYGRHALIFLQMFSGGSTGSREQLAIFFDDRHVVTFQERPGDCLDPVRRRLPAPAGKMRKQAPTYLAYAIVDTVIDAYFPLLERLGMALEQLEDLITTDPRPEHVARLHEIKRELLVVKRAVWPTRELLSFMVREDFDLMPEATRAFLRDTYDHAVQLIDIVETYRELSSGLLDLYLSSVSTRMNEVMQVLTIVATIFIPLTFLAGIWGMNFDPEASPWNMPELTAYYGYPLALLSMLVTAVLLLAYFRWKRWL